MVAHDGIFKYGNDLRQQSEVLKQLLSWTAIAPGHGHPRDYRNVEGDDVRKQECSEH
jgi:hypothetical protein